MKLANFNIQSVGLRSTKTINTNDSTDKPKQTRTAHIDKNIIIYKAIEFEHTKFKVLVDNILYDVVCPGYSPDIIFSSIVNDHWEYPKPDTTFTHDTVDDLDIYWDYLYDGMPITGTVEGDVFVINIPYLKKVALKCLNDYKYKQLKEAQAIKKDRNEIGKRYKT